MQAFICTEFEDLFTFLPQNQKIFHRMIPVSRVKDTLILRICHRLPLFLNKDNNIFYNLNQTIKYLAFNKSSFFFLQRSKRMRSMHRSFTKTIMQIKYNIIADLSMHGQICKY